MYKGTKDHVVSIACQLLRNFVDSTIYALYGSPRCFIPTLFTMCQVPFGFHRLLAASVGVWLVDTQPVMLVSPGFEASGGSYSTV